jgi:hypothetical protein
MESALLFEAISLQHTALLYQASTHDIAWALVKSGVHDIWYAKSFIRPRPTNKGSKKNLAHVVLFSDARLVTRSAGRSAKLPSFLGSRLFFDEHVHSVDIGLRSWHLAPPHR